MKDFFKLKDELEEAYSKFQKAVESYKELWEKFYYPSSSHRGSPSWQDIGECQYENDKIQVGIEVYCCGDYAYGTFRWVPTETFFNPSIKNLEELLLVYKIDDHEEEMARLAKKKEEDERLAKEREIKERELLQKLKEKYEQ